jgi:TonB family protein
VARLSADEARDYLSTALRPECTRLQQAGATPTGEARVTVTVAQNGDVVRSRLTQRTGDARIDELFGTTAARMKFDPDPPRPAEYTGRLRMGYSCSGAMAVGTIELF